MDWNDIDRLREPGFTVARRGYDRHEVDRFLGSLVDWLETDATKQLGELAVKRKLEFVGKSTARILLTTEEESAQLRRVAQEECAELRSQAEAASLDTRKAADAYAQKVRAKADDDARRAGDAAATKAKQIVEEGERRRSQIEAVVIALEAQRDDALQKLERLRAEIAATIAAHESGPRSKRRDDEKPGERSKTATKADAVAKA
jgi:DivIVA domain-containing protein